MPLYRRWHHLHDIIFALVMWLRTYWINAFQWWSSISSSTPEYARIISTQVSQTIPLEIVKCYICPACLSVYNTMLMSIQVNCLSIKSIDKLYWIDYELLSYKIFFHFKMSLELTKKHIKSGITWESSAKGADILYCQFRMATILIFFCIPDTRTTLFAVFFIILQPYITPCKIAKTCHKVCNFSEFPPRYVVYIWETYLVCS